MMGALFSEDELADSCYAKSDKRNRSTKQLLDRDKVELMKGIH